MESSLAHQHIDCTSQQPDDSQQSVTMITRMAAGGKAAEMVMISHHKTRVSGLSVKGFGQEHCISNSRSILETRCRRLIFRLVGLGLVLFGQIAVSVSLKRNGMISKDLNDIVSERLSPMTERVMPEIQHRLELFESRMHDTIEMAKLVAPNFDETFFWRGMEATASLSKLITQTEATQEKLRPGFQHAKKYGAKNKHPVVMIPGFVTSGLEVWKGSSCMKNSFRERIWGGLATFQYWLQNRYCIIEHLTLDIKTGGDPDGIKLRSSQGFTAADFFVGNDWMCK